MWLISAIFILIITLLVVAIAVAVYKRGRPKASAHDIALAYYEDGLMEMFFGLMIVGSSVLMLADQAAFIGILFAVLYPFLLIAKRQITAPRLQPLALTPIEVSKRMQRMFLILGLFMLLGLAVFFATTTSIISGRMAQLVDAYLLDGVLLTIVAALVFLGMKAGSYRLYIYATLLLLMRTASFWGTFPIPVYLLLSGISLFVGGLWAFGQFIHDHANRNSMSSIG